LKPLSMIELPKIDPVNPDYPLPFVELGGHVCFLPQLAPASLLGAFPIGGRGSEIHSPPPLSPLSYRRSPLVYALHSPVIALARRSQFVAVRSHRSHVAFFSEIPPSHPSQGPASLGRSSPTNPWDCR